MPTRIWVWRSHPKPEAPDRGCLGSLLVRLAVNAGALCTAAWLIPGIHLSGWKAILIAALAFGIVNAFIKPLVSVMTCLLQIATLGLFTLVINASMLGLTAWLVSDFDIDNFLSALLGAIIVSIVSFILTKIIR